MIIKHLDKEPIIDESTYIAPNTTICGDVRVCRNCIIMHGVRVIAEGVSIEIGVTQASAFAKVPGTVNKFLFIVHSTLALYIERLIRVHYKLSRLMDTYIIKRGQGRQKEIRRIIQEFVTIEPSTLNY